MSSFIDNIKAQNFEEIKKSEITTADIYEFAMYYQEVLDLKDSYVNAAIGRNAIANEIREKLIPMEAFLSFLTSNSKAIDARFESAAHFISDYGMAMRLLVRLANENGDNFVLKKFSVTGLASFERQHGDRAHEQIGGNIWVIGEKCVLAEVDAEKDYFGSEFGKVADRLVQNGHSLVILTDHCYVNNVMPWHYPSEVQRTAVKVDGMFSDISCYLYDDDLRGAVNKFMTFINQNGADIKGIDEEQLFEIMKTGLINSDNHSAKLFQKNNLKNS